MPRAATGRRSSSGCIRFSAAIVETVQQQVRPGAVVLLHDGGGPRGQTLEALEQLLPWLVAQGYRFGFPTP